LKTPFNENLNLFVLFLSVKAKLVFLVVDPSAATAKTAVGLPDASSGGSG
jgi:hypothetical protein